MLPEGRDPAYLWDMLEHARLALSFVQGRSYQSLQKDRLRRLALERALEIIGEAARRVSEPFRQAHPEIPWGRIIAKRNVLAHEYDEIYEELLWITATEHVPVLIALLEPLVPPGPGDWEEG